MYRRYMYDVVCLFVLLFFWAGLLISIDANTTDHWVKQFLFVCKTEREREREARYYLTVKRCPAKAHTDKQIQ